MTYYFYILRCRDNSLYCGITPNLSQRIKDHNLHPSKGAKYTKSRRPVALVYSEKHESINVALKREAEVKKWTKIKKESFILKSNVIKKD